MKYKIFIILIIILATMLVLAIPDKVASAPDQQKQGDKKPQNDGGESDDEDDPLGVTPLDQASKIEWVIVYLETGGTMECGKPGLSGEKGCHQYMPTTWEAYSLDVFGFVAEQNIENAKKVTHEKISQWLDSGLSPREIFLIWNQGNSGQCSSGINSHGVKYDSCEYAEKALNLLDTI